MNTTKTIAVINKTKILVVQNAEKLVPIKPICEALGIDAKAQRSKIQQDEILAPVGVLSTSTGSDGKGYDMYCIPFKYVFGWLFTINPANVKEEVREGLVSYKMACYDALYQSFTDSQEFLEAKQEMVESKLEELEEITSNFKNAKSKLYDKKKELIKVREFTIEDWIRNNRQLDLF